MGATMRIPVDTEVGATLPQLLDMADVAILMATSVRHVQRLVSERRIPFLKVGRFVRFDPVDLSRWLAANRVGERQPPAQHPWGDR
jgi:excisionase family DNA binding protein